MKHSHDTDSVAHVHIRGKTRCKRADSSSRVNLKVPLCARYVPTLIPGDHLVAEFSKVAHCTVFLLYIPSSLKTRGNGHKRRTTQLLQHRESGCDGSSS